MAFDFDKALEKRLQSTPHGAYLWCVELPDLSIPPSNIGNSRSFEKAVQYVENHPQFDSNIDMNLLNTLITTISTPFFQFDTDKVVDGSTFWYKANHNDISQISMSIEEQYGGMVWRYLKNWELLHFGKSGRNPPHFYKRDIKVHRLSPGKDIFQTFIYRNYFITEVSAISNDYISNRPTEYSVAFTGDSMYEPHIVEDSKLKELMDSVSASLESIDISYRRFDKFGFPVDIATRALTELSRRAFD